MDKNLLKTYDNKLERLSKALEKNNIKTVILEKAEDVKGFLDERIPDKASVALGGSMTVMDLKIPEYLRGRDLVFHDRYAPNLSKEDMKQVFRNSFLSDFYIASTNAVTMDGTLYNVDGTGNRTAAMIYGPDKVFVIIGLNKIVEDEVDAVSRVQGIAAPANNVRLNTGNPCTVAGTCMDCSSQGRICNIYTLIRRQNVKDRIEVVIVKENMGY